MLLYFIEMFEEGKFRFCCKNVISCSITFNGLIYICLHYFEDAQEKLKNSASLGSNMSHFEHAFVHTFHVFHVVGFIVGSKLERKIFDWLPATTCCAHMQLPRTTQ